MSDIDVPMPEGATPEEEKAAIDEAVTKKLDENFDEIFKDFPKEI